MGYENLVVWQKSMELVVEIYQITNKFPKSELYGLTSQMRRAAVSIPSNIAEGSRRGGKNEVKRFFLISFGSGAELETQVKIAKRLEFISDVEREKWENRNFPISEPRSLYSPKLRGSAAVKERAEQVPTTLPRGSAPRDYIKESDCVKIDNLLEEVMKMLNKIVNS